jgi:hypothetical protein
MDKSETYYRIYKRKGILAARKRIEADIKKKFCHNNYDPLYLTQSSEGYHK